MGSHTSSKRTTNRKFNGNERVMDIPIIPPETAFNLLKTFHTYPSAPKGTKHGTSSRKSSQAGGNETKQLQI